MWNPIFYFRINSGQFADVRQRIAQLQNTTNQFKADVQRLPDIKRSAPQQNKEIELLKNQIHRQLTGIQVANVKTELLLKETEKSAMASEDNNVRFFNPFSLTSAFRLLH